MKSNIYLNVLIVNRQPFIEKKTVQYLYTMYMTSSLKKMGLNDNLVPLALTYATINRLKTEEK